MWRGGGALAVPYDEHRDQIVNVIYHWTIRGMGQGKGSKAVLSIYKARRDAGWCCLVCFKVAFYIHVQKRVLPLHPHLLISVSLHAHHWLRFSRPLVRFHSPSAHSSACVRCWCSTLHATVLAGRSTRRGCVVGRYSVSVLLKQIIAGIEMIIEIEERIELLQGSINRKY